MIIMREDIRYFILQEINEIRRKHGKKPISLHLEESHNSKKHAEHLMETLPDISVLSQKHHAPGHCLNSWSENQGAKEFRGSVYLAVSKIIENFAKDPAHLNNMLNAKSHVATDISFRNLANGKKKIFLCTRHK